MIRAGTDPLQLLQDMAELVHFLTRAQIVKDIGADVPEGEKLLAQDLQDIKIPALTRAWQILLKGHEEVQRAPDPVAAAEMVLIRLAYAAELPLPADLIRQLRERKSELSAPQSAPPSGPS
jgi:DNA polymerase-3 subunit gamma/tau